MGMVMLSSALQRPHADSKARDAKVETSVELQQEVEPHNDFFTAQFLVPFPQAGLYNMNISTEWKDSDGGSWSTGDKQTKSRVLRIARLIHDLLPQQEHEDQFFHDRTS